MHKPPTKGPKVQLRALVTDDDRYVPLKFVESIIFEHDEDADAVIDQLKGKQTLKIHTLSGEDYRIDLSHVIGKMENPASIEDAWGIVFESWMYYINL